MEVSLIPLNGTGFDAQFIAGQRAQYKFFYIFIDASIPPWDSMAWRASLPTTCPSIIRGWSITGMTPPEMTDVQHWLDEENALAFGAGVTVGTLADNGFTAKAGVIFAIMLPGPVILIEGYSKVLSFDENYPFRVLAVLDVSSGTFLMNISTTYAFPKNSGDLLDVSGSAEAFLLAGDLGGWRLYLG